MKKTMIKIENGTMKKFVVKLVKIKLQFMRKLQVNGAGTFRIGTQRVRKC
jgi:hypothetical protein